MSVKETFLDLVSYSTASDETSTTVPSTPGQKVLGAHIVDLMKAMGIADARNGRPGLRLRHHPRHSGAEHHRGLHRPHGHLRRRLRGERQPPGHRKLRRRRHPPGGKRPHPVPQRFPRPAPAEGQDHHHHRRHHPPGGATTRPAWRRSSAPPRRSSGRTSPTAPSSWASPPTRRSAPAPTTSTCRALAATSPIPWTAASWASWSTKTSTPPRPLWRSPASASTPAPPKAR